MLIQKLTAFAIVVLCCSSAFAKDQHLEKVIVLDKIPTTTSYNWWVDGKSTTSCRGDECTAFFTPASAGTSDLNGAILKIQRQDGTVVIAECVAQERALADTLTELTGVNASKTYRSCRVPEKGSGAEIEAQFHVASVRLSFEEPSTYSSGKISSETYLIRGFLHPAPSPETSSVLSFQPEQGSREAACGPLKTRFNVHTAKDQHPLVTPDLGRALIYIIQEDEFSVTMLGGFPTRYGLDGEWIGADRDNSYFYLSVGAGEHHICGEWQIDFAHHIRPLSLASFVARPGEAYFFRARVVFASGDGQRSIQLEPVNTEEGKLLIARSAFSVSKSK